jgi:hypothetical protein
MAMFRLTRAICPGLEASDLGRSLIYNVLPLFHLSTDFLYMYDLFYNEIMLEKIPPEILLLVGEYLCLIHARSVIDLACVNKHCFLIVIVLSYRTLNIHVDSSAHLAEDVQQYSRLLDKIDGYGAVRRLLIWNHNDADVVIIEGKPGRQPSEPWQRERLRPVEISGSDESVFEGFFRTESFRSSEPPLRQGSLDRVHATNHHWASLASLISKLGNLRCILFKSESQFPPCLLDSIRQYQPLCRLSISRFRLWSLKSNGTADPYEYELLTSSHLHGIGVIQDGEYGQSSRNQPYWAPALREIITGRMPRLRHLILKHCSIRDTAHPLPPPQPWTGFECQQPFNSNRARLEHLEITGGTRREAEKWAQDIDFSRLKTVKLIRALDLNAIEYLMTSCQFPSLEDLLISFDPSGHRRQSSNYYATATSFLCGLPALSRLRCSGWHLDMTTNLVLGHHGTRLRTLRLSPLWTQTLSLHDLRCISQNCVMLTELYISVARTRGDYNEVLKYKAIGSIPTLRKLYLDLDASGHGVLDAEDGEDQGTFIEPRNDPSFNDFDQQLVHEDMDYRDVRYPPRGYSNRVPRNGHIRDAFINGTLDDDLARSIFDAVCGGRGGDDDSCALEFMQVQVLGAGQLSRDFVINTPAQDFGRVVRRLGGAYHRVHRSIEEGNRNEIIVDTYLRRRGINPSWLKPSAKEVFLRLWPTEKKDEWDHWHSFPLALSADEEIDWKAR